VEKPGAALFEQQAQQPAPAPAPQAPAEAAPAPPHAAAPGDQPYLTFQVGEFAHAASGKQLMATLEAKGFSPRMDQSKRNNKPFYTVFAGKEGSRAMLEAELLSAGVTEPRLVSERPATSKAPAAPAQKAPPAAAPKVSAPIAPPIVEPAPPLPDGYVPPPKKTGS
jgi:Meckel syndrome type 1 protein